MWSLTYIYSRQQNLMKHFAQRHLSDVLATSKSKNEASHFPPSFPTHSQQCCAAVQATTEVKSVGNFSVILLKLVNFPFLAKHYV